MEPLSPRFGGYREENFQLRDKHEDSIQQEVSTDIIYGYCLIICEKIPVPPDSVRIVDHTGVEKSSIIGPYVLGQTLSLTCVSKGGKGPLKNSATPTGMGV